MHITTNNTIFGTRYREIPDTGVIPLVADASSNILSEVYDINKFGLLYAGAQKNVGPSGLTVVIIRNDLVGKAADFTPTMLNYVTHVNDGSMYNTPPTYGIYIAKLVFQWVKDLGGIKAMQEINEKKAAILYDFLDNSRLFKATAQVEYRSLMNVPFVSPKEEIDKEFISSATKAGL